MSVDDRGYERLREAFASSMDRAPVPGPDCSDAPRIWAAVRGELPAEEAQALVDHALGCASCALAWRLAREVAQESGEAGGARAARRGFSAAHWAAVAAAVIAAVLIPVGLHEWRAPGPPVYRADERPAIRPLVPDGASLARDAFVLRWTAGPPGTRYSVRLVRSDLGVVSEAQALESAEYAAPPEALQGLARGTQLFWRVEAHLPDGSEIVSDTFSVRLE